MHFSLHPPDHRGFGPQYIRFSRPLQALQPAAATKKTLFHSWTITGGYCAIRVRGAGPIRSAGRREHFSSPPPPSEYDSFAPPARRKHFSLSPPPSEYVPSLHDAAAARIERARCRLTQEYGLSAPRRRRKHFSLPPPHHRSMTCSLHDAAAGISACRRGTLGVRLIHFKTGRCRHFSLLPPDQPWTMTGGTLFVATHKQTKQTNIRC